MKRKLLIGILIVVVIIVVANFRTISPIVLDDEYYVVKFRIDKNLSHSTIHNTDCPLNKNKWFKKKGNKYDILIEDNEDFCDMCFTETEIQKIEIVNNYNWLELYLSYRSHYGEEEAISRMKKYRRFDIN